MNKHRRHRLKWLTAKILALFVRDGAGPKTTVAGAALLLAAVLDAVTQGGECSGALTRLFGL